MKTSRYVAPVLACLLLLPLLLRDCAFAAPAQDNPDEEKIWRVIYVEGGPFSDYQRIFQGLALGLEERGLIENGHVPLPKDSEEARGMWEWLHQHAGGKRLVFLADGFYSANWDSQQREKVRQEVLRRIRENGVRAAISVKPNTPAEAVLPFMPLCDFILVMTVEPGFGGQSFLHSTMPKLHQLRQWIDEQNPACELEVDGGVNAQTAKLCTAAGANVLVAGSAFFKAEDKAAFVQAVK